MPYVKQNIRKILDPHIATLFSLMNKHPGELNYVITRLLHASVSLNGLNYTQLNELMGVLECVKQEFYRTVVAPYENLKANDNGPITDLDGLGIFKKHDCNCKTLAEGSGIILCNDCKKANGL